VRIAIVHRGRGGLGRLEVALVVAVLALLFQVFPGAWFWMLSILDVRNWSRWAWLAANVGVVLALFVVRFGPEWYADWHERQERRKAEESKRAKERELREQREMFERLKEAQKRRVY
jgi:hypothetical protein